MQVSMMTQEKKLIKVKLRSLLMSSQPLKLAVAKSCCWRFGVWYWLALVSSYFYEQGVEFPPCCSQDEDNPPGMMPARSQTTMEQAIHLPAIIMEGIILWLLESVFFQPVASLVSKPCTMTSMHPMTHFRNTVESLLSITCTTRKSSCFVRNNELWKNIDWYIHVHSLKSDDGSI